MFCAFYRVRVHLGLSCYGSKLGAKRAELMQLMQKFMPRCLVRIFHNERSWSTRLDPKLMFLCISLHLCAFGTVLLLHETCCKTHQTGAINAKVVPQCLVTIFRNKHSRSTTLHRKLMFWCVSFRLGPVLLLHETSAKRAKLVQLMQKFVPRCLVWFFHNERSRSTPLDPKLMFLCISFRSCAFGTVLLLHETCCKMR